MSVIGQSGATMNVSNMTVDVQDHGVTMVDAAPKWVDRLMDVLKRSNESNIAHSHLYASLNMTVGSWQRVDIPILPELTQYEYVLFTDADVYFRRPLSLDAFTLPLPETVGMATEAVDMFPYNAGIMLMHLPTLRETYDDFIDFSFRNDHGLFYPGTSSLEHTGWDMHVLGCLTLHNICDCCCQV